MNAISAAGFAPEREALVEAIPPGWDERHPSGTPASRKVSVLMRDAAHVSLATESSEPAFLVVNESCFPGWFGMLDGVPVPLVRTNLFVQGIPVPAGSHRVDLAYHPASLPWGVTISFFGALVTLLLCVPNWRSGPEARFVFGRRALTHRSHVGGGAEQSWSRRKRK